MTLSTGKKKCFHHRTTREAMTAFRRYVDLRASGISWREIASVTEKSHALNDAVWLAKTQSERADDTETIDLKLDDKIILALRLDQAPSVIARSLNVPLQQVLKIKARAIKFELLEG